MVYSQQSTVKSQQAMVNRQKAKGNGQKAIVNGQWSRVYSRWSIVNGQESMVYGQWSIVKDCFLLSEESYASVQVFASCAKVEVEAIGERDFVLPRAEPDAFGVGFVGIAEVHAVESSSDKAGDRVLRAVGHAAVEAFAFVFINQPRRHVCSKLRAVVAQDGRRC